MDTRDYLRTLPEPDPAAIPRVWGRFRSTRSAARAPSAWRWWWLAPTLGVAAAAAALVIGRPEAERSVALTEGSAAFSDTVQLEVEGRGVIRGTSRDAVITWDAGALTAEVTPNTGTRLSIVTEEATVRVIGTVLSVERDALGVTVGVEHGRVEVQCADGWSGILTDGDPHHTCLPVRPGALLGRADLLHERGAPAAVVLDSVDLGLARAELGSAIEGELLARRIELRADAGSLEGVLSDVDRYLAVAGRPREADVRRIAARLVLPTGCDRALPYLRPLGRSGTAEDRVVLASCLAASSPAEARQLALDALRSTEPVDPAWRAWAESFVGGAR
ncbi:MAG: FecR domain-containing protein [Myxococcota bacterium]